MPEIKKTAFLCTCLSILGLVVLGCVMARYTVDILSHCVSELIALIAGLGGLYTWKRTALDASNQTTTSSTSESSTTHTNPPSGDSSIKGDLPNGGS